jgi:hypothetical protein
VNISKIALLVAIGLTLVFGLQDFYPDFIGPFSNVAPVVLAGAAVMASSLALQRYGRDAKTFSLVWLCFTGGMFLWFLGELTWALYALVVNVEIPYPSIADVFWLAGYVPLFIALYLYVKIFSGALSRRKLLIILTAVAVASIVATVILIFPAVEAVEDPITQAVDLAYPLLDLALFSASLLGLAVFQKGKLGRSWLFINAAILTTVVADFLFSYTTAQELYYNGHPIDLLYLYSYLLFFVAFYSHTQKL